ncbi:hypothetical protein MTR67_038527 [Solanum verrucosum]|uniref:AB hydrolase-1 domain-containing protein n=1 Tax=Solanum verrucosum TaxID=315347 RepID=A0AAF0UFM2_SOLVR|nr:hypothetical protein MTR67_038527 [Solanum verrucosum]
MTSLPAHKNVVLVGHSIGGLAISKAMELFPGKISGAVFVAGLMPGPNINASTVYIEVPNFHIPIFSHEIICYAMQCVEDVSNEIILSRKRYGSIRRAFVVTPEDKLLKKEFQQLMIERNPPDEVKEIQGADHMVMMSKPHELFKFLLRFADKGLTHVSVATV